MFRRAWLEASPEARTDARPHICVRKVSFLELQEKSCTKFKLINFVYLSRREGGGARCNVVGIIDIVCGHNMVDIELTDLPKTG